jgi:hypothetical protein
MAKLRESDELVGRPPPTDEAPPTRESSPKVLEEKLARDSAERTGESASSRLTIGLTTALAVFAIAALVVVLGVALLIWRSRTAQEVAKSMSSELNQAAASVGCDDDEHEPNNRSVQGTKLPSGQKRGVLCPGDVDWFRLGHHSAGENVRVAVDYEPGEDDIDIELFVDATFEAGVYTSEKREAFERKLEHSGIVAVRLYFPSNESGEGRGYTVMREFEEKDGDGQTNVGAAGDASP